MTRTPPESQSATLRGIVVPASWGEDGEVLEVAISTSGEALYRVIGGSCRDGLLAALRKEVEARVSFAGESRVSVLSFAVVDVDAAEEIDLDDVLSSSGDTTDGGLRPSHGEPAHVG
jgi:hypothetical protein